MRPSTETRLERGALVLAQIVVGNAMLWAGLGGAGIAIWRAKDGRVDHVTLFVCAGIAVLGALILPSIFSVVKPILIFVFPNGIPMLGGRRATDPPSPPQIKE